MPWGTKGLLPFSQRLGLSFPKGVVPLKPSTSVATPPLRTPSCSGAFPGLPPSPRPFLWGPLGGSRRRAWEWMPSVCGRRWGLSSHCNPCSDSGSLLQTLTGFLHACEVPVSHPPIPCIVETLLVPYTLRGTCVFFRNQVTLFVLWLQLSGGYKKCYNFLVYLAWERHTFSNFLYTRQKQNSG